MCRATARSAGFHLVEVILVLAIIAVFAALAAPRYGSASARYRVDLAAQRVAADLRLAQSQARTTSSAKTVCFYVTTEQYRLLSVAAPDAGSGDYTVVLSDPPYHADLVSADFNGASQVIFSGWGLPNSGGAVVVSAGAQQRTITLDGGTGQVGIQ